MAINLQAAPISATPTRSSWQFNMATSNGDKGAAGIHPFECFSTLLDRHDGSAASFAEQEEYKTVSKLTK